MNWIDQFGINFEKVDSDGRGFFKGLINEYSKHVKKFNSPEVEEYIHNLVAAFMLEYKKGYENFEIRVPYRIKSPKSVLMKVLEYMGRDDKSEYKANSDGELQGFLKEDITDMVAFTVVGCNRTSTFHSNDPELQKLIEEKNRNQIVLANAQEFRLSVIDEEFSGIDPDSYNYSRPRSEYYIQLICLLERIKTLIDPKATKLLEIYDSKLEKIRDAVPESFFNVVDRMAQKVARDESLKTKEKVDVTYQGISTFVESLPYTPEEEAFLKSNFTESDVKVVNFLNVLDDFSARRYNSLDQAILKRQVKSIFEKSQVLKQFGVSLATEKEKRKVTEDGYVSDFIFLKTPLGVFEMQMLSDFAYKEGMYGYQAHNGMDGKKIDRFDLPPLDDKDALRDFRRCVEFTSPRKFLATYDNFERNRVIVQKFGDYQNYKSVATQVRARTEEYNENTKYFGELYKLRDKYFPNEDKHEKIESFVKYDLEEYLQSEGYKKIMTGVALYPDTPPRNASKAKRKMPDAPDEK